MIILAGKIISDDLLRHLEETKQPVLDNAYARERGAGFKLNLVPEAEAKARILAGERLYTTNEDALTWVYENLKDSPLIEKIDVMKDKAALRDRLAYLYPDFFYKDLSKEELFALDPETLKYPLILKLTVGFGSLGVYTLFGPEDLKAAKADIEAHFEEWRSSYTDGVVGSRFLLEELIDGTELAVDVYYDTEGKPVILNVYEHRFASARDVSDRLYCCGPSVMDKWYEKLMAYFTEVGNRLQVKDFPLHAELRTYKDTVIPIEFNPLRFAGLSTNEVAYYAYGFWPPDVYLRQEKPDIAAIMKKAAGFIYSFILIDKGGKDTPSAKFDYEALTSFFQKVYSLRKLDQPVPRLFAILLTATKEDDAGELDEILQMDFDRFLKK